MHRLKTPANRTAVAATLGLMVLLMLLLADFIVPAVIVVPLLAGIGAYVVLTLYVAR